MKAKEFWDQNVTALHSGRGEDIPSTEIEEIQSDFIKLMVGNPKGLHILKTDLWNEGIRPGCFDVEKYKESKRFVGVDISPEVCKRAKNKVKWIRVFCGEIPPVLTLYRSSTFDFILDISTIDHVVDHVRAIEEYFRLLKKGGKLFIIWNRKNIIGNLFIRFRRWMKGKKYVTWPYHFEYELKYMLDLLKQAGFIILDQGEWNDPFSIILSGDHLWHYMSHWAIVQKKT